MWFETIKRYYEKGIYNDEHLNKFVNAGMITEKQKQEIIAGKEITK